jgi:hypothetical protein
VTVFCCLFFPCPVLLVEEEAGLAAVLLPAAAELFALACGARGLGARGWGLRVGKLPEVMPPTQAEVVQGKVCRVKGDLLPRRRRGAPRFWSLGRWPGVWGLGVGFWGWG